MILVAKKQSDAFCVLVCGCAVQSGVVPMRRGMTKYTIHAWRMCLVRPNSPQGQRECGVQASGKWVYAIDYRLGGLGCLDRGKGQGEVCASPCSFLASPEPARTSAPSPAQVGTCSVEQQPIGNDQHDGLQSRGGGIGEGSGEGCRGLGGWRGIGVWEGSQG